jgi:hypothetical protein
MFILMPEPDCEVNHDHHYGLHFGMNIEGRLHGACTALASAMPERGA